MKADLTDKLLNVLQKIDHRDKLSQYIDDLAVSSPERTFAEYYKSLDAVTRRSNTELIRRSGIERSYFYQLMDGRRQPGRDKVILLGIAAGLRLREVQRCLEIAGLGILYSRRRRDAILIFCIENQLPVEDTIELLEEFGERTLV